MAPPRFNFAAPGQPLIIIAATRLVMTMPGRNLALWEFPNGRCMWIAYHGDSYNTFLVSIQPEDSCFEPRPAAPDPEWASKERIRRRELQALSEAALEQPEEAKKEGEL